MPGRPSRAPSQRRPLDGRLFRGKSDPRAGMVFYRSQPELHCSALNEFTGPVQVSTRPAARTAALRGPSPATPAKGASNEPFHQSPPHHGDRWGDSRRDGNVEVALPRRWRLTNRIGVMCPYTEGHQLATGSGCAPRLREAPAWAGNSQPQSTPSGSCPVHPRMGGELGLAAGENCGRDGPPPHGRGIHRPRLNR